MDEKDLRKRLLDNLPGMPHLLNHPGIKTLRENHPALFVHDVVRRELEKVRRFILEASAEELSGFSMNQEVFVKQALHAARRAVMPSVKPAINAAGVILHTALGRAPLADAARQAVHRALQGYCTLAINEDTGKRGDRHLHLDHLLAFVTGAESGIMVNNNAAGTMLILNTLAKGKEVIVSRGQLIEIGGAFRIPEVLERSGCKLVEVGTTNRTHLRDYAAAITENTALLLRVHTSNYRIIGFTSEVPLRDLTQLGRAKNIPVVDDLGSGALLDLSIFGLPKEPLVQESVNDGVDVVCFSGDKMLGGAQAGFLVGKREIIDQVKRNPLTRALRCDKMSYAAAEATLRLYLQPETLQQTHPVLSMILEKPESVRRRARALLRQVQSVLNDAADLSVISSETEMGSGSLPGKSLPTFALKVTPKRISADELGCKLRRGTPPVFARIESNSLLLDLRTVFRWEEKILGNCLIASLK
ncbi:MAG: L-seryl-tRNA(Sec) selenium transferase [bacterium]